MKISNSESFSAKEEKPKRKPLAKLDYFHGYLAKEALFTGDWDIPYIESAGIVPNKVITFSKCLKSKDYECWVVFYEDDTAFERFWKKPERYLPILRKFSGVVCPDFSLYGDYPLCIQLFNVYRSRVIGHWLSQNGIRIIPNVRWSTHHTYSFCFEGLKQNDILFVGSHGCSKRLDDREIFSKGLMEMVNRLKPTTICVYGKVSNPVFKELLELGISVVPFDSEFSLSQEVINQWD